jgi:predicted DCC family thiol-disulfide oxidoreductase YuxK
MPPETEYLLFFDPICPLCTRSVELLRRRGLLEKAEARPLDQAESLGLTEAEVEGVRSEMLLRSRVTGESLRGFDALVKLLAIHGTCRFLAATAAVPPLRALGRAAYRLVALNRRILSPPATRGVACACDPPFRWGWRVALLVALLTAGAASFFLSGLSLRAYQRDVSASLLGLQAIAGAGAGWVLALGVLTAALPSRASAIFWQSLVVTASGGVALLPFAVVTVALAGLGLPARAGAAWSALALASSGASMLLATLRRYRNLGLPHWAAWLWIAVLAAGGLFLLVRWDLLGLRPLLAVTGAGA